MKLTGEELIEDIELSIGGGYPDFVDSYIVSAMIDGRPATDDELDELNDDSEFVYDLVMGHYF